MSFDTTSLGLIIATVLLFALLARTTYQYRKQTRRLGRSVEEKVEHLERELSSLEKEYEALLAETNKKVDKKYLENRIKGLSELLG
ncbi:hypothetical protein COX86_00035 [Candidatus Micrarchaeota archaeon CG_4_10_14_0_2_um_filter_60_11]|nr:MAG: hypothetical protein AUJ16_01735 [Candidatus Micrarchaeota archaeon CG1_02_60_51]PIN95813.1 MAG: hypothetical protein COU39_03950 [Candidatus Micrarchaeota archaeon CG10_big_fil_rev_8_21_14_0_10_60_32]PIO02315.1 MAG: hypothetical protein COT58_00725 [Candidatus Micrarchaeota archaeon CG09_land_8_20_14_0_10_60_16]PIZ91368.1 MAG: hypothetical protein COX86_00035 [Candidatus Micrarchaeota archaeon CG_4_10_14_0_2_um_filter_60_11]